ncbi:holin [Enterococcus faecalis]|uniref:holin n=1 Tax=Enterococcus faecalis TaxID=1351 RepID=UPI0019E1876A|nr:hypothetical protein [Enterococcus faecalis]
MNEVMNTIFGVGIGMSSLVIIVVEVIKKPKLIPSDWLPATSCGVGIVLGVVLSMIYTSLGTWPELALAGVVSGAVASGIYTQTSSSNWKGRDKDGASD